MAVRAADMIPNYEEVVLELSLLYPEEFKNAHTGNAHTEDFIRIVAWEIYHKYDMKIGLNGKRGNPLDISDDALNYYGEGAGKTQHGVACNVIDVIRAAGSPAAKPTWIVFTDPQEASGAWVQPQDPFNNVVTPPTPVPPSKPEYAGDDVYNAISKQLDADYKKAGQALDDRCGCWFGRVDYSHYMDGLSVEAAIAKHRPEWLQALGIPNG